MTAAPTGGIVAIGGRLPFRVLLSLARPPPAPGLSVWQSWGTGGGASVLRHRSVSGSLRQRMGGRRGTVAKQGQRDPPPRPRIPQSWLLPQPTGQGTPRGAEARERRGGHAAGRRARQGHGPWVQFTPWPLWPRPRSRALCDHCHTPQRLHPGTWDTQASAGPHMQTPGLRAARRCQALSHVPLHIWLHTPQTCPRRRGQGKCLV